MPDPNERRPAEPRRAQPREEIAEVTEKLELLVGPRRSLAAKAQGIQPLSAGTMSNAVASLQRQEGVEVVREIRQRRRLKTLSTADEATTFVKVRADIDSALNLFRSAPQNMTVEIDSPLSYGQVGPSPLLEAILARQLGAVHAGVAQALRIRIVGEGDAPVEGAQVILEGSGFPQEGITDENGDVALNVFATAAGSPVRSLFVRPGKGYWNRYIRSPSLTAQTINVVRLQPLSAVIQGFPAAAPFGWGQKFMGLDQLPDEYTGKGVKIAIIDSGADNEHPVLKHIQHGVDLTNGDSATTWATDVVGHGSHCAGIIAGQGGQEAIRGFAPEAEVHVFKVFPGGQFSSLLDALSYCVELGIDVVNMSLGSGETSDAVEQQLDDALQNGVACIVAAGNSGGPVQYPARSRNVMAVAAIGLMNEFPADSWENQTLVPSMVGPDGVFSPSFTCFGPEIAVAAPGVGIVSTVPGGAFDPQSGTSMAAPHVCGMAALLLAHHPLFKSTLRERNASRVSGLFQLIRSLCTPLALGSERSGAGAPKLFGLEAAFRSGKEPAVGERASELQAASAMPGVVLGSHMIGNIGPAGLGGLPIGMPGAVMPLSAAPGLGGFGPFVPQMHAGLGALAPQGMIPYAVPNGYPPHYPWGAVQQHFVPMGVWYR
jgi:subtilisin family serine protease